MTIHQSPRITRWGYKRSGRAVLRTSRGSALRSGVGGGGERAVYLIMMCGY